MSAVVLPALKPAAEKRSAAVVFVAAASGKLPNGKKARIKEQDPTDPRLNETAFVGWSFKLLCEVYARLPHRKQFEAARVCKVFRAAAQAQRWTVRMEEIIPNLVNYVSLRTKIDTIVMEGTDQEGYKGRGYSLKEIMAGPQQMYLVSQLGPRKVKINFARPYGWEPYLVSLPQGGPLFPSSTKAVQISLQARDKKQIGLDQACLLLWDSTIGKLDFLCVQFLSENGVCVTEGEIAELSVLARKLENSRTKLNFHFNKGRQDSYFDAFQRAFQNLPNVTLYQWTHDKQTGKMSFTRYCQAHTETLDNLWKFEDPLFEAF